MKLASKEDRKKILLQMLRKNLGLIGFACRDAKVSRSQYYIWLKQDELFAEEAKQIIAEQVDWVENELIKKIKSGCVKSIHFYLKHKGGDNGFATNLDITTGGEKLNSIQIEIVKPKGGDELDD